MTFFSKWAYQNCIQRDHFGYDGMVYQKATHSKSQSSLLSAVNFIMTYKCSSEHEKGGFQIFSVGGIYRKHPKIEPGHIQVRTV